MCSGNRSYQSALASAASTSFWTTGRRVALDDEGAHPRRMAVVVGIEAAVLIRHESLRQRREQLRRAIPCKFVFQDIRRGAEGVSLRAPDEGIDAVRGDDEIVTPQFFVALQRLFVFRPHRNALQAL